MATWTGQTKDTTSWGNGTLDSTSFTNQTKTLAVASAGQYYGFGAFTYAGGEPLARDTPWNNQIEN